jgi:hypothetical protein
VPPVFALTLIGSVLSPMILLTLTLSSRAPDAVFLPA